MKHRLNRKEIQTTLLHIFLVYKEFCEQNNLQFYLTGGTLLGAVRHQGFIPWDDDLDLCMPRPDYNRFISLAKKELTGRYCVQTLDLTEGYPRLYMRFVDIETALFEYYLKSGEKNHLGIDVFPIDGIPENQADRTRYYSRIRILRKIFILANSRPFRGESKRAAILKTMFFIPARLIGSKRIYRQITRLLNSCPYEQSNFVGISVGCYLEKEMIKKTRLIADYVCFEHTKVPTYQESGLYLSRLYGGDYQTPPPAGLRKRRHTYDVFKI